MLGWKSSFYVRLRQSGSGSAIAVRRHSITTLQPNAPHRRRELGVPFPRLSHSRQSVPPNIAFERRGDAPHCVRHTAGTGNCTIRCQRRLLGAMATRHESAVCHPILADQASDNSKGVPRMLLGRTGRPRHRSATRLLQRGLATTRPPHRGVDASPSSPPLRRTRLRRASDESHRRRRERCPGGVVQVSPLLWLGSAITSGRRPRQGTLATVAALYEEGGVPRLYRGLQCSGPKPTWFRGRGRERSRARSRRIVNA